MSTLLYILQRIAFAVFTTATILAIAAQVVGSMATIGNLLRELP